MLMMRYVMYLVLTGSLFALMVTFIYTGPLWCAVVSAVTAFWVIARARFKRDSVSLVGAVVKRVGSPNDTHESKKAMMDFAQRRERVAGMVKSGAHTLDQVKDELGDESFADIILRGKNGDQKISR